MLKSIRFALIFVLFLSSFSLVNGIMGYPTDSRYDDDPYYINFYLEPNSTKNKTGFAEYCNTNSNSCYDVADLAPQYTKKKFPDLNKVQYHFVYPPHSQTKKQLIVIVNYNPYYTQAAAGCWVRNDTTIILEYQWTKDKIYRDNFWWDLLRVRDSAIHQDKYEWRNLNTNRFAFGMIILNLVVAFCVFFGSCNPRGCLVLIFSILCFGLLYLIPSNAHYELIIPFVIMLALVFKPNPAKRFILTVLVMALWELWYYKDDYRSWAMLGISLPISAIFFGAAYSLTKEHKNRLTIISTAYMGAFFPFIIYYAIVPGSERSDLFPYMLLFRHLVSLLGVFFQAKNLKEVNQLNGGKTSEEPTILASDRAMTNENALTNSLL